MEHPGGEAGDNAWEEEEEGEDKEVGNCCPSIVGVAAAESAVHVVLGLLQRRWSVDLPQGSYARV